MKFVDFDADARLNENKIIKLMPKCCAIFGEGYACE